MATKSVLVASRCVRASSNQAKARVTNNFSVQRFNDWGTECEFKALNPSNTAALQHFDRYYSHVYGATAWSGIRAALLSPNALVAVVNSFQPKWIDSVHKFLSSKFNCLDIVTSLQSTHFPPGDEKLFANASALRESVNSSTNEDDQHHFLLDAKSTDDRYLSEFVPPTQFISERTLYTRDSDKSMSFLDKLASGGSDSPGLLVVREDHSSDGITFDDSFWKACKKLRCFGFRRGQFRTLGRIMYFNGFYDFYPIDFGCVLAVLALDLQPGSNMLDLRAAVGGSSVTALQTLNLANLVCTDTSVSRLKRLAQVLNTFGPGVGSDRPGLPNVTLLQTNELSSFLRKASPNSPNNLFDRVLVDVPCSDDRNALISDKVTMFSSGREKSRIQLPSVQDNLLEKAMNACRPGGYVVYSTGTLSPAQNQAVVETCLSRSVKSKTSKAKFAIVDPTPLLRLISSFSPLGVTVFPVHAANQIDRSSSPLSTSLNPPIGIQLLPSISSNYGPTFICKIKRLE